MFQLDSFTSPSITMHFERSDFIFSDPVVVDSNKVSFSTSPNWAVPALSAFPYQRDSGRPYSHVWPFSGIASICSSVSRTEEPSTGHSTQMCLTRAEERGRMTSTDLLALLCLIQPRKLLAFFDMRTHCWLIGNSSPTRTSRFFSAKLLSNQLAAACPITWHYSIPEVRLHDTGSVEATQRCVSQRCANMQIDLISLAQSDSNLINSNLMIFQISFKFVCSL